MFLICQRLSLHVCFSLGVPRSLVCRQTACPASLVGANFASTIPGGLYQAIRNFSIWGITCNLSILAVVCISFPRAFCHEACRVQSLTFHSGMVGFIMLLLLGGLASSTCLLSLRSSHLFIRFAVLWHDFRRLLLSLSLLFSVLIIFVGSSGRRRRGRWRFSKVPTFYEVLYWFLLFLGVLLVCVQTALSLVSVHARYSLYISCGFGAYSAAQASLWGGKEPCCEESKGREVLVTARTRYSYVTSRPVLPPWWIIAEDR